MEYPCSGALFGDTIGLWVFRCNSGLNKDVTECV